MPQTAARPRGVAFRPLQVTALLLTLGIGGCATLQQFAAIQNVDFSLDGVSRIELAGIDMTEVRGFQDVSLTDGLALASAVRSGDLPLTLTLHVGAANPESNVDARLVQMDWTLFLDNRETVSGRVAEEVVLPKGELTMVQVATEVDLLDFFDGNASELFELARSFTGLGGDPPDLALEVLPVVQTVLGAIPYDRPLRITLPNS